MREIEVKLKAKDLKEVEQKLTKQGCTLSVPIRQYDVVYSPKGKENVCEEVKEGDFVLRIRRENRRALLTLKQQRTHELDNTEIETEIGDPDAMHRTLLLLGCTPVVEVRKARRKGKLKGYEICLDEVEKLGAFVELEKLTGDNDDPMEVTEELLRTLEDLGLSRKDRERQGYDTQIYKLEHKSGVLNLS